MRDAVITVNSSSTLLFECTILPVINLHQIKAMNIIHTVAVDQEAKVGIALYPVVTPKSNHSFLYIIS